MSEVTRVDSRSGRALRELARVRGRLRWLEVGVLMLAVGEAVLMLWMLR